MQSRTDAQQTRTGAHTCRPNFPLQIDTRNRVHGATPADVHKCTNFSGVSEENGKPCAGYEPRQARYGRDWAGLTESPKNPGHCESVARLVCVLHDSKCAIALKDSLGSKDSKDVGCCADSGILECPCNGRFGGDPEFYPNDKTKVLTSSITAIPSGSCEQGQVFKTAPSCKPVQPQPNNVRSPIRV